MQCLKKMNYTVEIEKKLVFTFTYVTLEDNMCSLFIYFVMYFLIDENQHIIITYVFHNK